MFVKRYLEDETSAVFQMLFPHAEDPNYPACLYVFALFINVFCCLIFIKNVSYGGKNQHLKTFITTCFFLIFLNETVRFVCEINNPFDISGALDDAVLFQRQAGEGRAAGED